MQQWVTVTEACQLLGVSERTLHRHLKDEKYQSKLEDGRRLILIDIADAELSNDSQKLIAEKDARISELQTEIEYLRKENEDILLELSESRQRSDTIILQLTRQFEEQTKMLEDMRHQSLWSKVKTAFGFACAD